jgi:gluconolactonase
MTLSRVALPALALLIATQASWAADEPKSSAPKGEVAQYKFDQSKIFPGTTRDYWIYVPKQYDPAKPACVFVCQDGVLYKAPQVFDELIAKKEIPVLIGVFVRPGELKAPSKEALNRYNRGYEYDGLGDAYARFVLDELLPDVEKRKTSDGRAIYQRKVKVKGANAYEPPFKPAGPRL